MIKLAYLSQNVVNWYFLVNSGHAAITSLYLLLYYTRGLHYSGYAPDHCLLVPPLCIVRPELAKPAEMLFLHNLTGTLEAAIRATNAQFDHTDLLQRLDVRLLDVRALCNPMCALCNPVCALCNPVGILHDCSLLLHC